MPITIITNSGSRYAFDFNGMCIDAYKLAGRNGYTTIPGKGYRLSVNQGDVIVGKSMRVSDYYNVDDEGYHAVINTSNVKAISVEGSTAMPHTLRHNKSTYTWTPVYDGKALGSLMAEIVVGAVRQQAWHVNDIV